MLHILVEITFKAILVYVQYSMSQREVALHQATYVFHTMVVVTVEVAVTAAKEEEEEESEGKGQ